MKRRAVLLASGAWAALACARAGAQAPRLPHRIAFLMPATRKFSKPQLDAFTMRLAELGYVEGRDVVIEKRWADGSVERLPALVHELLALKPEVVVAPSAPVAAAFKKATSTVPVVFTAVTGPDRQGFVTSYARPGGNMTGVAFESVAMATKLGEILREILPAARRIALVDLDDPSMERSRPALLANFAALGFEVEAFLVRQPEEFASTFTRIARSRAEIVFVGAAPLFAGHAPVLNELAAKARLPLVGPRRAYAVAGGLLSHDNNLKEDYRRAADYVARILKGAKPGELPVEQPERFNLTVNLRTAKALGISVPRSVLLRATEVIE